MSMCVHRKGWWNLGADFCAMCRVRSILLCKSIENSVWFDMCFLYAINSF